MFMIMRYAYRLFYLIAVLHRFSENYWSAHAAPIHLYIMNFVVVSFSVSLIFIIRSYYEFLRLVRLHRSVSYPTWQSIYFISLSVQKLSRLAYIAEPRDCGWKFDRANQRCHSREFVALQWKTCRSAI
jgi:hypothetical protein